jgi:hypothetical protein
MDYPGVTTTEPGLLHVLLIGAIALVMTYPLSLLLMSIGAMKKSKHGAIFRANEIAKSQMMFAFLAWIVGAALCYLALFAWAFVLSALVWLGLAGPVTTLLSDPFLFVCGVIHVVCQGYAYREAINETNYLTE